MLVHDMSQPGRQRGQIVTVDDLPAWTFRQAEVLRDFGIGIDHDVVPAQTSLGPAGVGLYEGAQCIAGLAGLAHRFDGLDVTTAALLSPLVAVVPDLAALDLDADDAGSLDGDDKVDLVVLEVVGDPLAGDDEVVLAELLDEHLPDLAFGVVGETRVVGEGDGHQRGVPGSMLSSHSRISKPPRSARFACAAAVMVSIDMP